MPDPIVFSVFTKPWPHKSIAELGQFQTSEGIRHESSRIHAVAIKRA